jgi:SNF2 family DNA or RNA helicase
MDRTKSKRIPQIVQKGKGGLPKYKNLDKLQRLIAPHTFRVLKKDCLDLPEKIYKTAFFDLTPQQQVHYDKALKECRLVYEGEETPVAKLVAVTKLAQITSGYFIHPEHEEPARIAGENPKLNLMRERVRAIVAQGSKVIVWARYHVQIEDIVAALKEEGVSCVEYHGRVKMIDREAAKISFQEGDASVMVAQQQAGGTGVTWTAADYTLYFSNTFSLRDRLQSEDRNHRIGQTNNVTYIDLVASDTVDVQITRALVAKKNVADLINGDGKDIFPT